MTTETSLVESRSGASPAGVLTEPNTFAVQLGSSRRSVQLARRITLRHLAVWGVADRDSDTGHAVAIVVTELCANAVTHGRVAGRDFRLAVTADRTANVVRVEVCDASGELPKRPDGAPSADDDCGRGLLLVDALTTRWGGRGPGVDR